MKKQITDGWHKIAGYSVFVESGYILRGMKKDDTQTAYVYRWNDRNQAWSHESSISPDAFRAGLKRGTIALA